MNNNKVCLIILDGWGIGVRDFTNPIFLAGTPYIDYLKQNYPYIALQASGLASGLDWKEEGSSEIGHLILGAGRSVLPAALKVDASIKDNSFFENKTLLRAINIAKAQNSSIHFVTMLSSGNNYTKLRHLYVLLDILEQEKFYNAYFDIITDGLQSKNLQEALQLIEEFIEHLNKYKVGTISSVCGRYYALNKDSNKVYIDKYLSLLTQGQGTKTNIKDIALLLEPLYKKNMNDDFIEPIAICDDNNNVHPIHNNDIVFMFNIQSKHKATSELINRLTENNFQIFSLVEYDNIPVENICFFEDTINNTLAQTLSNNHKRQLHIAEEIKQNHITNIFNGFHTDPFPGEYWNIIPSVQSLKFIDHPEMMAHSITERASQAIEENIYDFILLNYANADQAGHSGNINIAKQVVKLLDEEIREIVEFALKQNYTILITSDHGNIEYMVDRLTGKPQTAHDANLVPLHLVSNIWKFNVAKIQADIDKIEREALGLLSDVAPTILDILDISKPKEMTGTSLLKYIHNE